LQDVLLLAHQARSAWTALGQAAKALKDISLDEVATRCGGEVDREIDWICTHIKTTAPQALSVPVDPGQETKKGLPRLAADSRVRSAAALAVLTVGVASLAVFWQRRFTQTVPDPR
jgi:hypothetical protein